MNSLDKSNFYDEKSNNSNKFNTNSTGNNLTSSLKISENILINSKIF
jgi:hypothetical protein